MILCRNIVLYLTTMDSVSVVRVHCRDLWTQFDQHADADSDRPLQSHLTTSTKPLLDVRSPFHDPHRRLVGLGRHLGRSTASRLGKLHRRRFPGEICHAVL